MVALHCLRKEGDIGLSNVTRTKNTPVVMTTCIIINSFHDLVKSTYRYTSIYTHISLDILFWTSWFQSLILRVFIIHSTFRKWYGLVSYLWSGDNCGSQNNWKWFLVPLHFLKNLPSLLRLWIPVPNLNKISSGDTISHCHWQHRAIFILLA